MAKKIGAVNAFLITAIETRGKVLKIKYISTIIFRCNRGEVRVGKNTDAVFGRGFVIHGERQPRADHFRGVIMIVANKKIFVVLSLTVEC